MAIKELCPSFMGLEKYNIDELFSELPTPAYVLDEAMLKRNGEILKGVQDRTGCKILLAQKAFSNFNMYGILGEYLAGTEASGLYEARLGAEEMPDGEVHVFCGAYKEGEFQELLKYADHIVFNSVNQLEKFGEKAKAAGKSIGLRVNPECSTQEGHEIYDPCALGSRLGVTKAQWDENMTKELIDSLDGIHFHTLCEQGAEPLATTLAAVEEKFGEYFYNLKWVNFGGGHHITKEDYNIDLLEQLINHVQKEYKVQVYLEPGEACALNAGYLVSQVLDVTINGEITNVILDASAACHMPDVIGVAEVENRSVLSRMLASTGLRKFDYAVVHRESGDRRGIDVALLYRRSSMSLLTCPIIFSTAVLASVHSSIFGC